MSRSLHALTAAALIALSGAVVIAQAADAPPAAPAVAQQPATQPQPAVSQPAVPAAQSAAPQGDVADQAAAPKPKLPYPSIFFWPDEAAAISKAIADRDHPPAADLAAKAQADATRAAFDYVTKPHRPNVYVSAILDFGDGNWTVWANGLRLTPKSQTPLFHINAVHNNTAEIVVPGDDGGRFVLQPYQTWRARQKDVVEGIVP